MLNHGYPQAVPLDEARALGGIVDYTVGTRRRQDFCLAEHTDPKQRHYLNLYKMGEDRSIRLVPYHLVHFEAPNCHCPRGAIRDNVAPPLEGPVVEVCAVASATLPPARCWERVRHVHHVRARR